MILHGVKIKVDKLRGHTTKKQTKNGAIACNNHGHWTQLFDMLSRDRIERCGH